MELQLMARSSASRKPQKADLPEQTGQVALSVLLGMCGRPPLDGPQTSFIAEGQSASDVPLRYSGSLDLLKRPAIAIVGAREVSEDGAKRAHRLAKGLSEAGLTIVSGLAKGVDTYAHRAAIAAGGSTVAVIGTPLDQAYPAQNRALQTLIGEEHLVLSPFAPSTKVWPSNFPKRNRVMAALTDGTVIIEASDSSGTLHQAVECERLGRYLFILQSVFEDPSLGWPKRFARYDRVKVVSSVEDVIGVIPV